MWCFNKWHFQSIPNHSGSRGCYPWPKPWTPSRSKHTLRLSMWLLASKTHCWVHEHCLPSSDPEPDCLTNSRVHGWLHLTVCVYVTHFNLCLAGASMEPCGGQKKVYRTQFSPTLWSLEFTLRTTSAANAFIHWAISLAPGHLNYTLTQVSFVFKRCRF